MHPAVVWTEFTRKLRAGELSKEDCRPVWDDICLGLFITESGHEEFRDWLVSRPVPEWEQGEDRLLFFVDRGTRSEVRVDFVIEDDRWYLYCIDGITIPIKSTLQLPFDDFPELNPRQEAIGRREGEVHLLLKTYLYIKKEKGKAEALAWFRDGKGMRACTSAWMPYFKLPKAFIVLMGWRENRLHGEDVTIQLFSDERCVLVFRKHIWLSLYDVTTQFRHQISREEYREIFEYIWQNRAQENRWHASFQYDGDTTTITFVRASG